MFFRFFRKLGLFFEHYAAICLMPNWPLFRNSLNRFFKIIDFYILFCANTKPSDLIIDEFAKKTIPSKLCTDKLKQVAITKLSFEWSSSFWHSPPLSSLSPNSSNNEFRVSFVCLEESWRLLCIGGHWRHSPQHLNSYKKMLLKNWQATWRRLRWSILLLDDSRMIIYFNFS